MEFSTKTAEVTQEMIKANVYKIYCMDMKSQVRSARDRVQSLTKRRRGDPFFQLNLSFLELKFINFDFTKLIYCKIHILHNILREKILLSEEYNKNGKSKIKKKYRITLNMIKKDLKLYFTLILK